MFITYYIFIQITRFKIMSTQTRKVHFPNLETVIMNVIGFLKKLIFLI